MTEDKEARKKKREARWKEVDRLFEDYRKSGITLMTTIVGLSSGGFFGLFQIQQTREISFLYLIPITIALMQQLAYYLGSKYRADSKLNSYYEDLGRHQTKEEWTEAYV